MGDRSINRIFQHPAAGLWNAHGQNLNCFEPTLLFCRIVNLYRLICRRFVTTFTHSETHIGKGRAAIHCTHGGLSSLWRSNSMAINLVTQYPGQTSPASPAFGQGRNVAPGRRHRDDLSRLPGSMMCRGSCRRCYSRLVWCQVAHLTTQLQANTYRRYAHWLESLSVLCHFRLQQHQHRVILLWMAQPL